MQGINYPPQKLENAVFCQQQQKKELQIYFKDAINFFFFQLEIFKS